MPRFPAILSVALFVAACADPTATLGPNEGTLEGAPFARTVWSSPVLASAYETTVLDFEDLYQVGYPHGPIPWPYHGMWFNSTWSYDSAELEGGGINTFIKHAHDDKLGVFWFPPAAYPDGVFLRGFSIALGDEELLDVVVVLSCYDTSDIDLAEIPVALGDQMQWVHAGLENVRGCELGNTERKIEWFLDDLTFDLPSSDPVTKDDCKNGGWKAFGFKNQGQCVRFVETGKDSR